MPDFHLPERTATLVFEEGDLEGLELEVRLSLPFDALFKMQELVSGATDDLGSLRDLLRYFADTALISWNLTNGQGPVPLNGESLTAHLDAANAGRLLTRYLEEVGKVPAPLARPSASGRTSRARRASTSPRS